MRKSIHLTILVIVSITITNVMAVDYSSQPYGITQWAATPFPETQVINTDSELSDTADVEVEVGDVETSDSAIALEMQAGPNVDDYLKCVNGCKELFPDDEQSRLECIRGCSKTSSPEGALSNLEVIEPVMQIELSSADLEPPDTAEVEVGDVEVPGSAIALEMQAGPSVGDYLKCVNGCKELFPNDEKSRLECIKGCSKTETLSFSTDLIEPATQLYW